MRSWLRRHRFALIAVSVAGFLGSAGLDHHSPAHDWIVRAAVFGAIAFAAYIACSLQIDRIDRANRHPWGKAITIVAVILGMTAAQVGDAAIVAFAAVIAGAAIALDRAGLLLQRSH